MDKDCAIRAALAGLGGVKKFDEQFLLECKIMEMRTTEPSNKK
jgi:hypothetical protein